MFRRVALIALIGLAALVGALLWRTFTNTSRQLTVNPIAPTTLDNDAVARHLAGAITHKTISFQAPWEVRGDEFKQFHQYLAETFPKLHATLKREVVADNALLYTWPGSDASMAPIVLLAHMDVVPVDKASERDWTHPPFAGEIADGYIWGRGAIDDKSSVISILEATEHLISSGFAPRRTIYFAFGSDEELGGTTAKAIADVLKSRQIMAEFTLDEGSGIVQGIVPGVARPLALVGLGEKGYLTLTLNVKGEGGHSSQPPAHTAIGILSEAITRLENNPLSDRLEGPMLDMLRTAGPEMSFPMKLVMSNLWLFKPVIMAQFAKSKTTAAALHTTTAVTMMNAGTKENVLPIDATATVNFRILQGDTVASITEHVKRVINDERVQVAQNAGQDAMEAGRISETDSPAFKLLARTAREVMPECAVGPSLVLGATDSKHYYEVSKNQYRFQPMLFTDADLKTIHGTNERIAIDNLARAVQFYIQLLKNAQEK